MIGAMPKIIKGVQNDNRDNELKPAGKPKPAGQSPALLLDINQPGQHGYEGQSAYEQGVYTCHKAMGQ